MNSLHRVWNRAIFLKTGTDSVLQLAACAVGTIAFVVLFSWAMLNMGQEVLQFVSKFGFLRKIFESTFGLDVTGEMSMTVMFAVSFAHLMVMFLTWTPVIAISTRATVGEIERGTADLLLTLPVSRPEVYFSTSLVWMVGAIVLATCPLLGIVVASRLFDLPEAVELSRYGPVVGNLAALLLSVGGVSCLVSTLSNRRGSAIAVIVAVGVVSATFGVLEPFLEPLKPFRWLSVLTYFRPVDVVRADHWPWPHISVLLTMGGVCWLVGAWRFAQRDIHV